MKYTLEWLHQNTDKGLKFLYFWGHRPRREGLIDSSCLSQWWEAPFVIDGEWYKTAEHWMMAQKALLFEDHAAKTKIVNAKSPGEAKAIGREIKNFKENVWAEKRYEIVLKGSLAKFGQHSELKNFLLTTKDRVLVEASPLDYIWGIGLAAEDEKAKNPESWEGLNLLGFALMEARDIMREEQ